MNKKFKVTGMSCAACVARVESSVKNIDGVQSCAVNLLTGSLTVVGTADGDAIKKAVEGAGYGIKDDTGDVFSQKTDKTGEIRTGLYRLIISLVLCAVLMLISMGHMLGLPTLFESNPTVNACVQAVLALIIMVINRRFFISGIRGAIKLSPNMDTLISLGSLVSFVYSVYITVKITLASPDIGVHLLHGLYFESAAMILALISLGKLLENVAKGKTTSAIQGLIDMAPTTATLLIDGKEVVTDAALVKIGDVFIVRPGERISCDGVVLSGYTSIDESFLTGESVPKEKKTGDSVFAGTINKTGFITCKVVSEADGTVLAGVIKMVSDAAATKAPIARLADRVSGVFVPFVILVSLLTLCGWLIFSDAGIGYAIERAVSVLVISCPCALGLATPVAIMVGGGVGAKHGILFKDGTALETLGKVHTVVFDKTGTLTEGRMSVCDVKTIGIDSDELVSLVYGLEQYSEHPVASAIVAYAENLGADKAEIDGFSNLEGRGVYGKTGNYELYAVSISYAKTLTNININIVNECDKLAAMGKTVVVILRDGLPIGIIAVQDTVKSDANRAISEIRSMGIRTVILTGDNRAAAAYVCDAVGADEVIAEVLPSEKEAKICELMKVGRVCMVGDGINDAPALTRADVGIAIGNGTDIAIDSANVVLPRSSISDVCSAIYISRATLRNVKENLFFAFVYNCIGIPLAAGLFGISMPPMLGALAMGLSSFSVVMNALRLNLLRPKFKKGDNTFMEIKKTYSVKGMMCPHCEARVKSALEALDEVILAVPSHKKKSVSLTLKCDVDDALIKKAIEDAGYTVV